IFDNEFRRHVTPFAAIVFDRAWPEKEHIPREMRALRKELAPMRRRLQRADDAAIWGTGRDEQKALKEWQNVFGEIENTFGRGEGLLTVKYALDFAKDAGGPVDDPTKIEKWLKALVALPVGSVIRWLQ